MSPSSWEEDDSCSEGGYVDSDCSRDPFSDSSDEDDVVKSDSEYEDEYSTRFSKSPKPQSVLRSMTARHSDTLLIKRQKTQMEEDGSPAGDETKTGKSSLLPLMPLDVQQEIFSKLSLKEVLNVARTTKGLRAQLMTKKAATVWKMARENSSTPDCPFWLSEPGWASLLFGNTCEYCGAKNTSRVDTMILKRLCRRCKAKHLVNPNDPYFPFIYRNISPRVLDLLPAVENSSERKFIWGPDIEALNLQVVTLQEKISNGSVKSMATLNRLYTQELAKCAYLKEHHGELDAWQTKYFQERRDEIAGRVARRWSQIQEQMITLGYLEQDIKFLEYQTETKKPHDLTTQEWDLMEPLFVTKAMGRRDERLHREACNLRCTLLSLIEERYLVYKKTQHPSKWKYLPPTALLVLLDPFFTCLTIQTPLEYSSEAIDTWFQELSSSLAQVNRQRMSQLLPLLPSLGSPSQPELTRAPTSLETYSSLELATSVFTCVQGCYLFGYDAVVSHHCGPGITSQDFERSVSWFTEDCAKGRRAFERPLFQWASKAAAVVAEVVKYVGLDPTVTRVADLDEYISQRNGGATLRFGCDDCSAVKDKYQFYKLGYDWRGLAAHLDTSGHNPSYSILELAIQHANECRDREIQGHSVDKAWVCTHCVLHAGNPQEKTNIIQHLLEVHAIARPIEPNDLVIGDTAKAKPGQYGKYSVCSASEAIAIPTAYVSTHARCLQCTDAKGRARLFKAGGVVDHLKGRHGIVSAKAGDDFEFIIFK